MSDGRWSIIAHGRPERRVYTSPLHGKAGMMDCIRKMRRRRLDPTQHTVDIATTEEHERFIRDGLLRGRDRAAVGVE